MPHSLRRSRRIKENQQEQRDSFVYNLKNTRQRKGHRKNNKKTRDELYDMIVRHLDQTLSTWNPPKKSRVMIRRNNYGTSELQRSKIQTLGKMYGCHECGDFLHLDKNQPWIGDHIPPTNLSTTAKIQLGCQNATTYLFPSCDACSHEQAQLVKKLNGNPSMKLTKRQKQLICGRLISSKYGIKATGPKVTAPQGKEIQRLGVRDGCHICDTKYPASKYDADHSFPQEYCTSYMEQIFQALDIDYPEEFELRPHCPRCSRRQGGNLSSLRKQAVQRAKESGLVQYKD